MSNESSPAPEDCGHEGCGHIEDVHFEASHGIEIVCYACPSEFMNHEFEPARPEPTQIEQETHPE